MQYAKIVDNALQYPSHDEFNGIPNWTSHEPILRSHGYLPLVGTPEDRDGYIAVPDEWHIVQQSETHIEPRRGEDGQYHDTEIIQDKSYIQIDEWRYEPIPAPEPPVVRFSKYLIKLACEKRNLWEQVKAAIEVAGKWESFLLINDIASDNAELLEALPAIVEAFGNYLGYSIDAI